VWVVHNDTENRHVHIAVNRIDPETHKAIQPAGRWTHKAIQRAARKIELAQGWGIETHGSYAIADDGSLIEKDAPEQSSPKLSKPALDLEAHTAAKSAERICQETAAPILREARTWEELHRRLADQGIAFEKKGSGAILMVGDIAVKASKAGRDLSMSRLETRLGEYRPRPVDVSLEKRPAEPVERVSERGVKGNWDRYTAERDRYFREKKEAAAELNSRQKIERSELQTIQKQEREKMFSHSWKGMGDILNRRRSVLAASQQAEKLNLRDRHYHERSEMKKRFPARFVNFKKWLETREENQEAFISFRYPDNGAISGADAQISLPPPDIRAFTPSIQNKGGVAYSRADAPEAEFIDYGKKIVLAGKCGDEAILAALQLANQKWGGAVINGTEKYKQKCVQLAAKYNLKLSNPELAREVEAIRQRMLERMERQEAADIEYEKSDKESTFIRYADAVGAERFRILVTEFTEGGTKAFIYDRKNGGREGKTQEEILGAIPKFSACAREQKNIIVTPLSPDKHHILIDDLTKEKLQQLRDDGYSPACVIESSPGNFQAIITVPSVEGDAEKDRIAANRLTKELNLKYGDPKLSGSVHGHRLPPFPNCKPKHRREDGSYPETTLIEANGGVCEKARQELETIHISLKEAGERARKAMETREAGKHRTAGYIKGTNPGSAYWAHYRDIISKQKGEPDYSRIDAMIGTRMKVTDHTRDEVRSALENNAPAMRRETMSAEEFTAKYRNRDWRRYAEETTENYVFGPRGTIQFEKALDYRPLYMRIEGRENNERQDKKQSRGR
ncbi:MAG: relaxase/mobilization nuclease domain-containing protein, partial [Synergistaceae bacterium]|nr:relaxase/mobilization nuclease domain-containing protein [Synergistaceae bacterium]